MGLISSLHHRQDSPGMSRRTAENTSWIAPDWSLFTFAPTCHVGINTGDKWR